MEVHIMEESCKQLWFAVLKQAIKDAQEHYSMYGENAQLWFNSKNQENSILENSITKKVMPMVYYVVFGYGVSYSAIFLAT